MKRILAALALGLLVVLAGLELVARARQRRAQGGDWQTVRERMAFMPYTQFGFSPYDPDAVDRSPYFGQRPWPDRAGLTVILGGSTAAGARASDYAHTFFRRAAAATGVEVVGAAHPSFVSGQELSTLALQVLPRRPARVVVVSGFNDVFAPALYGIPPGYPTNWRLVQWLFESPGHSLGLWLGRHSALANLLVSRDVRKLAREEDVLATSRDRGLFPVQLRAVLAAWETNVRAMAALCRGAQVDLTFVAQPSGVIVGAVLPAPYDNPEHATYLRRTWPRFVEHAAAVCTTEGVRFVDATAAVPPEHFVDPAHFTDAGHAALGAVLAATLVPADAPAADSTPAF